MAIFLIHVVEVIFAYVASLPQALSSIGNNTVINITSQAIPLHGFVKISGSNITITSSAGTTIMCNNTGAVYCDECIDFTIKAIKWDSCGIVTELFRPGIYLHRVSNVSMINCIFQHFKVCVSVFIEYPEGSINIANCTFMFNALSKALSCAGFQYHTNLLIIPHKSKNIIISDSLFHHNGITNQGSSSIDSLVKYIDQQLIRSTQHQSLLITHTKFIL